jgi:membrane protein YqaA with SNARE-associated domain
MDGQTKTGNKMKWIRNLYDWVLHWAETPYGPIALFAIAFAEASFFPIPPDPLLIALVLGVRQKAFRFAMICTLASVCGGMLGYAIGYFAWWGGDGNFSPLANFFLNNIPGFTVKNFLKVQELYQNWDFWVVFTAGFTPLPYKVFTISGGAFVINFPMFMLASIISRAGRFYLVAFLIWKFGPQIKDFIEKYFNWLAIAFTVLLIGSFVLIKYML